MSKPPSTNAILRVELYTAKRQLAAARAKVRRLNEEVWHLRIAERDLERRQWLAESTAARAAKANQDLIALWRSEINLARAQNHWRGPLPHPTTGDMIETPEEYAAALSERGLLLVDKSAKPKTH